MITLIGLHDRTSGIVRCQQMAQKLGGQFLDLNNASKPRHPVCVVTRNYRQDVVDSLKKRGHIVGYDIADMPVGDAIFRNKLFSFGGKTIREYAHSSCDFFIVNNTLVKSEMSSVTDKPVFVIPHHNCNFEQEKSEFRKLKRVGYVGLPEQLSQADIIANRLREFDVELVTSHPSSREECCALLKTLDVGIVYTDTEHYFSDNMCSVTVSRFFKPNVKLANYQSFGVPTLAVPYASYEEFGGSCWLTVESINDLVQNIAVLKTDDALRKKLSDSSFENSENYHINVIAKHYESIVEKMS